MRRFTDLLKRFRRDESGAFLVIFAIMAIVLIATSGAVVDFTYTQTARSRAQNALDAAALALQGQMTSLTNDQIKTRAAAIMTERLADTAITTKVNTATVDLTQGRLNLQAQITVPTAFVQLVGIKSITAQLTSEATQGSKNLEVSVALDITGSMAATYDYWGNKTSDKIGDLISATNTLITLVVKSTQTPTFSRMAIIPWSNAVNVSALNANNVRGPETGASGKTITAASWSTGNALSISGITRNNPGVVSGSGTPAFANNDTVYITGVSGMTKVNGKMYQVKSLSTSGNSFSFSLYTTGGSKVDTSSFGYNSYSSGGTVQKCTYSDCDVTVTSAGHGFANGDFVRVVGVGGMTGINDKTYSVSSVTSSKLVLDNSGSDAVAQTFSSGGTLYCTKYKCPYFYFQNASNGYNTFADSTCVSERDSHTFDDTAPSTTYLNFDYPASSNPCLGNTVVPLTDNTTTLTNAVKNLAAAGSTAGQIGLGWGWYMISPNFSYLWSGVSGSFAASAYTASNLIKAEVLMTDGAFNTPYCSGVIASDGGSGSGGDSDHISCMATNGASATQAASMCAAIKAKGVVLYTVGFDLGSDTTAKTLLSNCATDSDHFFDAENGADLTSAFKKIAQDLNQLRLSK